MGAAYMAYRAHVEVTELRSEVEQLTGELAYWRETGGRLMEGIVKERDQTRPGGSA
jgi:hypothetical protein